MQTQYSALGYRTDVYFHANRLAGKIDENGHINRTIDNEKKTKSSKTRIWV